MYAGTPMRRWMWRVLTGVCLVIFVSCSRTDRFGIVFVSDRDDNLEIYRMTSDGRNVERLTYTPDDEQVTRASPDGSRIAFDRGGVRLERDIYLLDVDSGVVSQLTDAMAYDLAGSWSPDGSQIAFISDRDGGFYHLYLMSPDGSDQQHVPLATDPERSLMGGVSWSPDGRYIVYAAGGHPHAQAILNSAIFIVDLTTQEVTRLTDEEQHGACEWPDWSPDGQWIAMVCTEGVVAGDYGEIYVIHPDGSGFRQVTVHVVDYVPNLPENSFLTWVREPCWSPDGKQIVYAARVSGPWNIYVVDRDGKNDRRLTDHDAADCWLSVYRLP